MRNETWMRNGTRVVLLAVAAWVAGGVRGQSTAPGRDSGESWTKESAERAVQLLALKSPNPYVREMAYHEHDGDWALDLKKGEFSVKIAELDRKVVTGKLQPTVRGVATATFDDEAGLSRDWIVPREVALSAEDAQRCLTEMADRMDDPRPMILSPDPSTWYSATYVKTLVAAMKDLRLQLDATGEQLTNSPPRGGGMGGVGTVQPLNVEWRIFLRERTFTVRCQQPMAESAMRCDFAGRFGWDKDRHWTAWPVEMTAGVIGLDGGNLGSRPAIPEQNLARGKPVLASSSLEGHGAEAALDGRNSTFWQPAADDLHPAWTVDLKATVSLSGVRMIFSGGPGYREPTIEVSDDQKTWRAVPDSLERASGVRQTTQIANLPAGTTARFIRLSFPAAPTSQMRPSVGRRSSPSTRSSQGETIQLSEVAIDGTLTGDGAQTTPAGATRPAAEAAAGAARVITAAVVGASPAATGTDAGPALTMVSARAEVRHPDRPSRAWQ